ncbi:MAG: hypothetical protein M1822_006274 [Bathelium mastoideum]|nr:MAG: hypothetical protein M1822_006274 [Bathelium mastoideum]
MDRRCKGIRVFAEADEAENLADAKEEVEGSLCPDAYLVGSVLVVWQKTGWASAWEAKAGGRSVDERLEYRRVSQRESCKEKCDSDAGDGSECNASLPQEREKQVLDYGTEDYAGDWVEGLNGIVGEKTGGHLASLRDYVIEDLVVAEVKCRGKKGDTAGEKAPTELEDEAAGPGDTAGVLG